MINNEAELFEWLKNEIYIDLAKSENPVSRWDCVSYLHDARIELKCRKIHYPTLLLEQKKYDAMMAFYREDGIRPLYINSTPEGIYSFELHKLGELAFETNWLNPKTTHFSNNNRVPKSVTYLDLMWGDKLL